MDFEGCRSFACGHIIFQLFSWTSRYVLVKTWTMAEAQLENQFFILHMFRDFSEQILEIVK